MLPPNNTTQNTPVPFGKQTAISKPVGEFQSGPVPRSPTRENTWDLREAGDTCSIPEVTGTGSHQPHYDVTMKYSSWSGMPGLVAGFAALGCPGTSRRHRSARLALLGGDEPSPPRCLRRSPLLRTPFYSSVGAECPLESTCSPGPGIVHPASPNNLQISRVLNRRLCRDPSAWWAQGSVAQRERCPPHGRAEIAADCGSMHFDIILITYYCTSIG